MRNAMVCSISLVAILFFGNGSAFGQFTITKDSRNPVLSGGSEGTWNKHVFNACVIYNEDSSRYEMWFAATPSLENYGHPWQVGFAKSPDGVNWTSYSSPVMSRTPGSWDDASISSHIVLRENGSYKMWYGSWKGDTADLGYATSPDGIQWTKYPGNPVFGQGTAAWEVGGPDVGTVMRISPTGYRMWYYGYNADLSATKIGLATSPDGIHWTRDAANNPMLDAGKPGEWDAGGVAGPKVVLIKNSYYMWYSSGNSRSGLATSLDGNSPWVKHPANPVLNTTPGGWDATAAMVDAVLLRGDAIHFWYDGWRSPASTYLIRIGHATSPVAGSRRLVPQNYATIQAAIDSAHNGDTVLVSDGTYYENIRFKGKSIVVASTYLTTGDTSHIAKTIIDGSHATDPNGGSVVCFADNEDTTSVLCGFTITGGTGTSYFGPDGTTWREGGGVFCDSAGAKLVSNNIVLNRVIGGASGGGGVGTVSFGATPLWLVLEDNRITDNYVLGTSGNTWGTGGGVDVNGMSFRVVGNVIERDTAIGVSIAIGGGLNLYGLTTSAPFPEGFVQGNIFRNNIANGIPSGGDGAATGAGVFCYSTGPVVFTENTFEGNIATAVLNGWAIGGGICIDDREAVGPGRKWLTHNQFVGNHVQGQNVENWGGAIDLFHTVATVTGNLISANTAAGSNDARGGGIQAIRSSFQIENNIITENQSTTSGGGLQVQNAPDVGTEQMIANNTFVGNKATTGGGLDIVNAANVVAFNNILWGDTATTGPEINATGAAPVIQYCDVAGGYAGTGNIVQEPLFVDSTYRLSVRSPCIGAGIDSLKIGGVWHRTSNTCFYGSARPNPAGSNPDIGACENALAVPLTGSVTENPDVPKVYGLSQNFPNPFNPSTVVRYQLPAAGNVKLVVYDLLGREVAVLVNEKMAPGNHEVKFDGSGLASGVYFYRMQAGDFVQTRRLLLLK